MISRPLISSIGKTITNCLKNNNINSKSSFLSQPIPLSKTNISTFIKSQTNLFTPILSNNNYDSIKPKLSIYKININQFNQIKRQFSTNNKVNEQQQKQQSNENEPLESIEIEQKEVDEIQEKIEQHLKNNKHSTKPTSEEGHLIFEHIDPYKFKILFFIGIAQFVMFLFILEEYIVKANQTSMDFYVTLGGAGLTVLTQLFFRHMGKKQIASIHTYNKGRVLEITSYSATGFPTRKRIVNINNLISAPGNNRIATPVFNQNETFFIKCPGDLSYYQAPLEKSLLFDTKQLDRIIHFSKAKNQIKQTNKMIKKNANKQ